MTKPPRQGCISIRSAVRHHAHSDAQLKNKMSYFLQMHFLDRRWGIITKNKIYFIQISIEIQMYNSRWEDVETLNAFIDPNKTTIDELFDISKTMWKKLKDHIEEKCDGELSSESSIDTWGKGDCSFDYTDFTGDRDFVLCTNPLTTISILENGKNHVLYSTKNNNTNLPLGDIITSFPLEIPSALHHGDLYYINEKECYRDDFDLFSRDTQDS